MRAGAPLRVSRREHFKQAAAVVGAGVVSALSTEGARAQFTSSSTVIEFSSVWEDWRALGWGTRDLMDGFNASQNRVRAIFVGGINYGVSEMVPKYAAGIPPAVFMTTDRLAWPFAGLDIMQPLNDFIRLRTDPDLSAAITEDFFPGTLPDMAWRGEQLFLPYELSVGVSFGNQNLMLRGGISTPKPGWTWNDAKVLAQRIRSAGVVPPSDEGGFPFSIEVPQWQPYGYQNGASAFSDDRTQITINTPAWIETLQFLRDMRANDWSGGPKGEDIQLPSGKVVFEIGQSTIRYTGYVHRDGMDPDHIGYVPSWTQQQRATSLDGNVVGLVNHPDPEQHQAGFRLIAHLVRPESLAYVNSITGNVPPRRSSLTDPVFEEALAANPVQRGGLDEMNHARGFLLPISPMSIELRRRFDQAVKDVVLEGKPAAETLQQAQREIEFEWQRRVVPFL